MEKKRAKIFLTPGRFDPLANLLFFLISDLPFFSKNLQMGFLGVVAFATAPFLHFKRAGVTTVHSDVYFPLEIPVF